MKLIIKILSTIILLLPLIFTGCIKDGQPDCPEETVTVTVIPNHVQLSFEAHTPASQILSVTCRNTEGLPDDTYPWTLAMPQGADLWLQLTLDPTAQTGKGTSVSGAGDMPVYLVAQENTSAEARIMELFINNEDTVAVTVTQEMMPIQITPANITLSGVPHTPATQTVYVSSNGLWTLTANQSWLLLSLNENGSQALKTISGERTRTVYLVAEGNRDDVRTAGIYLNDNERDVRVTVVQESLIAEPGQAEPRIFISGMGVEKRLLLTKDPTNYGAYFQFGSIIGWNWDEFTAGFNPINSPNLNNWNSVWNNGNKDVVHNHAELLLGRGDPCRIVGYTISEIQTALAAGRTPDNEQWRLPANTENIVFGQPFSEWTTISGIAGRVFTSGSSVSGAFLPAAGRKIAESAFYGERGNMGFYISSSIYKDSGSPYSLFFRQQDVDVADRRDSQSQGFSVRCVHQ